MFIHVRVACDRVLIVLITLQDEGPTSRVAPKLQDYTAELQKFKLVVADGRLCICCKCKDTDPDVCFVELLMIWGYPAREIEGILRNCGKICMHCFKVAPSNISKVAPQDMGVTMSQSLGVQSFRPEGDFAHLILSAS